MKRLSVFGWIVVVAIVCMGAWGSPNTMQHSWTATATDGTWTSPTFTPNGYIDNLYYIPDDAANAVFTGDTQPDATADIYLKDQYGLTVISFLNVANDAELNEMPVGNINGGIVKGNGRTFYWYVAQAGAGNKFYLGDCWKND